MLIKHLAIVSYDGNLVLNISNKNKPLSYLHLVANEQLCAEAIEKSDGPYVVETNYDLTEQAKESLDSLIGVIEFNVDNNFKGIN